MAELILLPIILLMVVVLLVQLVRKKPVKKLLITYVVILGSYYLFVTYTCGPNSADVKVMKPMAQKIADYIVANGMPESLMDIPDLPYKLDWCSKLVKNRGTCSFSVDNLKYRLEFDGWIDIYSGKTETILEYRLEQDKYSQQWKLVEIGAYSSKTSGICQPFRP